MELFVVTKTAKVIYHNMYVIGVLNVVDASSVVVGLCLVWGFGHSYASAAD